MSDWQKEREEKLADLVMGANLLAYLLTVSVFVVRLPRSYSFTAFYLILLGIFLPVTIIVAIDYFFFYDSNSVPSQKLSWWNVIKQAGLFFTITCVLFLTPNSLQLLSMLYLLPVILASITFGRGLGILAALLSALALSALAFLHTRQQAAAPLESIFLASGIFLLVAWFLSGVLEVEKKTTLQLSSLADSDELTGLGNFRFLCHQLTVLTKGSRQPGQDLSLVLLDIDHFKLLNDTYGHQLADNILKEMALLLRANAPSQALLFRYGPDNFAIILPEYDLPKAIAFAQTLRQKVASSAFLPELAQPCKNLTVSLGLANYPYHVRNQEELFDAAENALVSSKFTGRNNVRVYLGILEKIIQGAEEGDREVISSLKTLMTLLNAKDRYTYGHSERVTYYVKEFAEYLELPAEEIRLLEYGSFLHDIGKLDIPRGILHKKGPLSAGEWKVMRNHPCVGADILQPISFLQPVIAMVLHHHENYDGTGYPLGLRAQKIPLYARILRIVDSFDAMRTVRPYRNPLSLQQALQELERYSGSYYDPPLVKHFIGLRAANPAGSAADLNKKTGKFT